MKRRGISLVEICVAMVIMGIIGYFANVMLKYSYSSLSIGQKSSEIQSNVRVVTETINNVIKNSTAIFLIPNSSFSRGVLSEGWDYVGTVKKNVDGKTISQVVHYKYNPDTETHDEIVLSPSDSGALYQIKFQQNDIYENQKLINFSINGYDPENLKKPAMSMESEMEALNSLQVVNYSSDFDYSSAIAFRMDNRNIKKTVGQVSLVLDCSGSMMELMEGQYGDMFNPWYRENSRSYILREAAQILMTNLYEVGATAKLNLTTFSDYASTKYANGIPESLRSISKFMELGDYYEEIFDIFNVEHYTKVGYGFVDQNDLLDPIGLTNIGDGLRLSYYSIMEEDERTKAAGDIPSNYMILLIDGENNVFTHKGSDPLSGELYYGPNYVTKDPTIFSSDFCDDETPEFQKATEYLETWAEKIKSEPNIKVYFIVLSSVSEEKVSKLKYDLGVEDDAIFKTVDREGLGEIFNSIGRTIVSDLWFLNGPQI